MQQPNNKWWYIVMERFPTIQKSSKVPKCSSEAVDRRSVSNAMAERRTNNSRENTTEKTIKFKQQEPHYKPGGELGCSGRDGMSCYTSAICRVIINTFRNVLQEIRRSNKHLFYSVLSRVYIYMCSHDITELL